MAEVVLTTMAAAHPGLSELEVSSAGTGNWHAGEPMDLRAQEALAKAGYPHHDHRARAFPAAWLDEAVDGDLVVCLDRGHQQTLRSLARGRVGDDRHEPRLVMLRSYDRRAGGEVDVPDPYYGDQAEFDRCLAMIEVACTGLVEALASGFTD